MGSEGISHRRDTIIIYINNLVSNRIVMEKDFANVEKN